MRDKLNRSTYVAHLGSFVVTNPDDSPQLKSVEAGVHVADGEGGAGGGAAGHARQDVPLHRLQVEQLGALAEDELGVALELLPLFQEALPGLIGNVDLERLHGELLRSEVHQHDLLVVEVEGTETKPAVLPDDVEQDGGEDVLVRLERHLAPLGTAES